MHFLSVLQERLHAAGWILKPDTGWSDYDFEIPAHFVARLQLSTATETLAQGKCNVRCRVKGLWSAPAKVFFTITAVAVVVLVSLVSGTFPWIWMTLPLIAAAAWAIDNTVQAHAAALFNQVDAAAQELGMVPVEQES